MLKVQRYYDVICEKCGCSLFSDFNHGRMLSLAFARNVAEMEGFVETPRGKTLCAICAAAAEARRRKRSKL